MNEPEITYLGDPIKVLREIETHGEKGTIIRNLVSVITHRRLLIVLESLESKGLVTIEELTHPRKTTLIRITNKGREYLRLIAEAQKFIE